MSIKVRYFASLKELVGRSEDTLTVTSSLTADQVWQQLNAPKALPANVLVALNMNYVTLDTEITDGDELAFFPPVTGG